MVKSLKELIMNDRLISIDLVSLIEASPDAYFTIDFTGKITGVNAAAEAISGYTRAELCGTSFPDYISEPQQAFEDCRHALEGGMVRDDSLEFLHKDGHRLPISMHGSVYRDCDNQISGTFISVHDISEQKAMEAHLREKERLSRTIADMSSNWLYLMKATGEPDYVSPACETISGYSPQEFKEDPALFEKILHPEDRVALKGHLSECIDTHQESPLEFRIITKKKEIRWILHSCQPLYFSDGSFVGRWITNQDITQRKQSDQEHARAEKRLNQLTHQLITIQEAERTRISQDLHDDIGQGMTDLLLRLNAIYTGVAAEQEEVRSQIREAVQSVEALMNQVRQLAHQLRPPSLDSVPLSKALESLCSSFAEFSNIYIDYSSDKDLPPIPGPQSTALYRLVQEGLNNAVKHAIASSIWINLDYVDGEVSLSLEDNGRGFSETNDHNGMGLWGLQERFRLLNGGLEIESAPGKGTRLYGYLPMANHNL
jgi:two-component system sensor histidine kinase UhpB